MELCSIFDQWLLWTGSRPGNESGCADVVTWILVRKITLHKMTVRTTSHADVEDKELCRHYTGHWMLNCSPFVTSLSGSFYVYFATAHPGILAY